MPSFTIALLAFQAVVFLIWTVLAFRWLFALCADALAQSNTTFPGLGTQLRAIRGGLMDERYAKDRFRLIILTFVLLGTSVIHVLL